VRIQSGRIEFAEGEPGVVTVMVVTKDPALVIEQRGDSIDVYSESDGWTTSKRAEVYVTLPSASNVSVRCASADVEAALPLGKVEIKSASGDIDVMSADKVIIKTASGDTTIGAVDLAIRFNSASGDLHLTHATHGSVVASTASGDVRIAESDAILEVNTVSGDVMIERFTGKGASLKSMSGSIQMGIPAGTKVDLDVSLLSGRAHLPAKSSDTSPTGRHMSVKVKSVSGDLTINRINA
jgi:hypothetical protein